MKNFHLRELKKYCSNKATRTVYIPAEFSLEYLLLCPTEDGSIACKYFQLSETSARVRNGATTALCSGRFCTLPTVTVNYQRVRHYHCHCDGLTALTGLSPWQGGVGGWGGQGHAFLGHTGLLDQGPLAGIRDENFYLKIYCHV